jgi:hypothetical protein
MTGRLSKSYFQPGVPWVAFIMLVFWCLLEATIFTHTLFPTVSRCSRTSPEWKRPLRRPRCCSSSF